MTNVAELFVRMSADSSGVKKGTDEAVRHMKKVETASTQMNRTFSANSAQMSAGMNAIRGSMTSVAAAALQTAPGVAQLGSVIGSLALGSTITVGVLAGLAAIAFAWDKFTAKAREAKQATEDALAVLDKLGAQPTEASTILSAVQVARAQLAQIELAGARIRASQSRLNLSGATDVARQEAATRFAQLLAENEAAAERERTRIQNGEAAIRRIHAEGWAKLEADRRQQEQQSAAARDRARTEELRAAAEHAKKLEELARRQAPVIAALDPNRDPFGPTANYSKMVAVGGVRVPNAPGQDAGLTSASDAMALLTESAMGVVSSFTPLGLLSTLVSSAFEAMAPAIEVLLLPVQVLGQLLGGVVNRALSYFAEGLGYLIKAIGWVVDKVNLFGGDGGIGKFGQELIDGARAARRGLNGVATAANKAAASITNMPEIFDLALRRRQAMAGSIPGTTTGGGGSGGGVVIHLHNPPANLDTQRVVREVTRGLLEAKRRGGTSGLDLLGAA